MVRRVVSKDGWNEEARSTSGFATLDGLKDRSDEKSIFFPFVILSHPPVASEARKSSFPHFEIISDNAPFAVFGELEV